MKPRAFIELLQDSGDYRKQVAHIATIPEREASFAALNFRLNPLIERRLDALKVGKLYSHQAAAVNAVMEGEHVVVVTSTASGKTLCYNLPILQTQLSSHGKRALYLFPTKALAQDQLRKLKSLSIPGGPRMGIYDGDTPQAERRSIKRNCDTILTNPDMLHMGILPRHSNWSEFFANLGFVVIDEMHSYRGIFGAHVGNIIRRLRRICRHYGSVPQFITCSATIANPAELMKSLTGVKAKIVDNDGSPSGERSFVFWNPSFVAGGQRRSTNSEASGLFIKLIENDVRNITFTKSRVASELIYRYAKEKLRDSGLDERIMPYRGGYTAEQRRKIERGLFDGDLTGVIATNALELGVDVGDLDASVLVGYPGSISSTWQQAGRAGRGLRPSLAIMVAESDPIDQFLMRDPEYLLDARNERAVVDTENAYVLAEHLQCAAYELPITQYDSGLFGGSTEEVVSVIQEMGYLTRQGERLYWSGGDYPARGVNIRSTGGDEYVIFDKRDTKSPLGTVDESSAFQVAHAGAVYLHQGESYVVERLDLKTREAYVARWDVDYYTTAQTAVDIRVKSEWQSRQCGLGTVHLGDIVVNSQVLGYWKKALFTNQVLETRSLDLPLQMFETTGIWITLDSAVPADVVAKELGLEGGIHAAEHAVIGLLPLRAMCDRSDVGGSSYPLHPTTGAPTIFIYDAYPGGVGISESVYLEFTELVDMALGNVASCTCEDGCPSCIQSSKCGNNNTPLDKASSVILLKYLSQQ